MFRTKAVLKSQDTTWSTAAGDPPDSLTGSFILVEFQPVCFQRSVAPVCLFVSSPAVLPCHRRSWPTVDKVCDLEDSVAANSSRALRIRLAYVTRVWMQWSRQDDTHQAASSALALLVLPNSKQPSLQSGSETSFGMTAPQERECYHFMTLKMQRMGSSVSQHSGLARASKSLHISWRAKQEELKGSTHAEVKLRAYKC